VLASDVRLVADGGAKVRSARDVVEGADRVAQGLVAAATGQRGDTWWRAGVTMRSARINGLPGIVVQTPEGVALTAAFEIEGGRIRALYVVRNPDKLRHVASSRPR
jgi:RNA polymerase sigma-70 factor (ECF subfamily)